MRQYRAKNKEKELERQRKYQAEYQERKKTETELNEKTMLFLAKRLEAVSKIKQTPTVQGDNFNPQWEEAMQKRGGGVTGDSANAKHLSAQRNTIYSNTQSKKVGFDKSEKGYCIRQAMDGGMTY